MNAFHVRHKLVGALGAAGLIATLGCGHATAGGNESPVSAEARQSYSLGHAIGRQIASELGSLEAGALANGFRDAVENRETAMSADEMVEAIVAFEAGQAEAARAGLAELAEANEAAGTAFRAEFAQQEGVVNLDSGLLYKVIAPGVGDVPEAGGNVTVHYRGTLIDGTAFDDSRQRGEPVTMELARTLPGLTEALERMPAGAHWQVVIPPALAYGEQGAMGFIEPNTTLVFELERIAS